MRGARRPRSVRAFDPDRVADLEVDMWRACYGRDTPRLIEDLTLMREYKAVNAE